MVHFFNELIVISMIFIAKNFRSRDQVKLVAYFKNAETRLRLYLEDGRFDLR